MSPDSFQNAFGYFGKLPTFGDFIHQLLPQDFANGFHTWLQQAMAAARARMGDEFLQAYLNCPAWKFALSAGVCGEQAVAGVTIPSVDRVGRYFNFTLATVLAPRSNPLAFVLDNPTGFAELENAALDILESDYDRNTLELRVREVAPHFHDVATTRAQLEENTAHLVQTLDRPLPFSGQSAALMDHFLSRQLGAYSAWWSGQQGQEYARLILSAGMPADEAYLRLLLRDDAEPTATEPGEENYIDRIIAGETGNG